MISKGGLGGLPIAYEEGGEYTSGRQAIMNNLLLSGSRRRSNDRTGDLEMNDLFGPADDAMDADMQQFQRDEAAIQTDIESVRTILAKLEEAHQESQVLTSAKAVKALKQRMVKELDDVSLLARRIKAKIEALEKSNAQVRTKPGCGPGSVSDRTRTSRTSSLKLKLKEITGHLIKFKEKIQRDYFQLVERRVFLVTGEKPDEDTIERLIEEGKGEEIFQQAIQSQGRQQILGTIAEIQERHDAVKDIEKRLLELNQIFLDMALLVEAQGEMLNDIESNVDSAQTFVGQGTQQLQKARRLQLSTRKWTCCAILILLIIIIIIVLAAVQPWKKK
ncbi:hypothetical protein R1sor_011421 [Riccia sorocarpa]|uniref:t-SNARE coiled-coil homology domain-containing protein n=1 Tax=Riccia sorocarpa TaxID=122646 RepID=A0ABD3I4I1_9MARC